MKLKATAVAMAALLALALGCNGKSETESTAVRPPATGTAAEEETIVRTMDEYREEAAREITADNAEEELAKLEAEIEADIAAGE
jgi:uncharacterized lipoprotein NlpE involved in copper resistance